MRCTRCSPARSRCKAARARRREVWTDAYESGMTLGQIAQRWGYSRRAVSRTIKDVRRPKRPFTLEHLDALRTITSSVLPHVIADFGAGMSPEALAAKYNCTATTIHRWLCRYVSPVLARSEEALARRQEVWSKAHREGYTIKQIARRWGVNWDTVFLALSRPKIRRAA